MNYLFLIGCHREKYFCYLVKLTYNRAEHLVCDQARNEMVVNSIKQSVNNDRSVMVLTERKEHIELLAKMMTNKGIKVVELHGGISTKQRQERIALLSDKAEGDEALVILTT
jgi:superfamily II DNA/RNA helicase